MKFKIFYLVFSVLTVLFVPLNSSEASNWHSGYKYHDTSLGFDIYWKWDEVTDIQNYSAAIRIVASAPITELCANLNLFWNKDLSSADTYPFSTPYMNWNALAPHNDSGVMYFDLVNDTPWTKKHLSKTQVQFVRCDTSWPDYPPKGAWNGYSIQR